MGYSRKKSLQLKRKTIKRRYFGGGSAADDDIVEELTLVDGADG